jgi:spermidine synthase
MIVDGWFIERGILWPGQAMCIEVDHIVYHQRSKYQDILVFQSKTYGMVLVLDGIIQVTERDEFSYQEMITHIPIYSHNSSTPKNVLCIGGGDGGVLRELCKHSSIEHITICEIDEDVINVSKQYLPSLAIGYDDPRVTVYVGDGFEFLQNHQNEFDIIITDSSDPVGPGSVLFETPYYTSMYHALRNHGIICTQGECMWLHLDLIQPLIQSIQQLYTTVEYAYTTIPTYPSGQIGFIIATKSDDTTTYTTCRLPRRVPDPTLQSTMKYYTSDIHTAAFALPAFAHRTIYGTTTTETTTK